MDYEKYWALRKEDESFKPRFSVIEKWITPGSSVLSLGCGNGIFESFLVRKKGCQVTGADISETALQEAEARGIQTVKLDLSKGLNITTPFDYVICSEILEHLSYPKEIMGTIKGRRLFRKLFICTIPNIAHWRHRLRLLSGKFPVQYEFEPSEHLRYWSIPDFKDFVSSLGLRVEEIVASNGFSWAHPFNVYIDGKFGLHKIWPNLFGNQICFKINYA